MKKINLVIITGALLVTFFLPIHSEAGVRVYVRYGPPRVKTVKIVKPAKPFRNAVWASGHWKYAKGRYIWVKGHYIKTRRNSFYVPAHWVKTPRGHYFVPGHWTKKK